MRRKPYPASSSIDTLRKYKVDFTNVGQIRANIWTALRFEHGNRRKLDEFRAGP